MSSLASAAVAFDAEAIAALPQAEAIRKLALEVVRLKNEKTDLKYEIRALHRRVERLEVNRLPRS